MDRLASDLRAAGITKEGVVEDAVAKLLEAGVHEEQVTSDSPEKHAWNIGSLIEIHASADTLTYSQCSEPLYSLD